MAPAPRWVVYIPLIEQPARRRRRDNKIIFPSPWLTLNDRDSRHRRAKLTHQYRDLAKQRAEEVGLPKGVDLVHITAVMAYGYNRILDPSNYTMTAKAIVDGFTDYGLVKDDNSKHVIGPDMRRDEKLPKGMTMFITVMKE